MSEPQATILVVDDLPANRLVLERHLQRLGHQTFAAEDGRAALAALRERQADLIMLDIMMPVMSGFETLEALKADPALAHIPVVVISALNDVASIARCINLGAEDFLFKPVDRVLLEARVDSSLARKRMHDRELAAYAAAEEARLAKDRFVSQVSHELKGPLTALSGYTDLLLQIVAESPTSARTYLQSMRGIATQMAALIEDLGDLSRIESGNLRLSLEPLSLESCLEGALAAVQGALARRGHSLSITLDPDLPLIWADSVRLVQVLTNLLSNACKYTQEGGAISLTARPSGPSLVEVTVRDNGPGIEPAEQARIFEPFFRSADATVRLQPGTGLGLSITRHLVELQGGTIWFTSAPGQGTAFSFTALAAQPAQELQRGGPLTTLSIR